MTAQGSTIRGDLSRPNSPHYRGRRRIMVAFTEDQFADISSLARLNRISFAEQVRMLIFGDDHAPA